VPGPVRLLERGERANVEGAGGGMTPARSGHHRQVVARHRNIGMAISEQADLDPQRPAIERERLGEADDVETEILPARGEPGGTVQASDS
jgi:hypothetical protein